MEYLHGQFMMHLALHIFVVCKFPMFHYASFIIEPLLWYIYTYTLFYNLQVFKQRENMHVQYVVQEQFQGIQKV